MGKKMFVFLTDRANKIMIEDNSVKNAFKRAKLIHALACIVSGNYPRLRPIYNVAINGICPVNGWKKIKGVY